MNKDVCCSIDMCENFIIKNKKPYCIYCKEYLEGNIIKAYKSYKCRNNKGVNDENNK